MNLYSDFCFPPDLLGQVWRVAKIFSWRAQVTEQEANHQTPKKGIIWSSIRSLPFSRQVKGLHLAGKSVILTPAGSTGNAVNEASKRKWGKRRNHSVLRYIAVHSLGSSDNAPQCAHTRTYMQALHQALETEPRLSMMQAQQKLLELRRLCTLCTRYKAVFCRVDRAPMTLTQTCWSR